MTSRSWSLTEREHTDARWPATGAGARGEAVELRRIVSGGRNSRIYRVEAAISATRSSSIRQAGDPRDRLVTEVGALRLMEQAGLAGCRASSGSMAKQVTCC